MVMYYHGADPNDLVEIMEFGLDPAKSQSAEDEKRNYPKSKGTHYFVYLACGISTAEDFTPDNAAGVILRITPPRSLSRKFNYRRGEFVRSPVIIPPEYIEIVKYIE